MSSSSQLEIWGQGSLGDGVVDPLHSPLPAVGSVLCAFPGTTTNKSPASHLPIYSSFCFMLHFMSFRGPMSQSGKAEMSKTQLEGSMGAGEAGVGGGARETSERLTRARLVRGLHGVRAGMRPVLFIPWRNGIREENVAHRQDRKTCRHQSAAPPSSVQQDTMERLFPAAWKWTPRAVDMVSADAQPM